MKTFFKVLAMTLALSVTACSRSDALTQENLDKIHEGMSSAQVRSILGTPTDSKQEPIPVVGGTKTTYIYSTDDAQVTVVLKNDTVQSKEGHFETE